MKFPIIGQKILDPETYIANTIESLAQSTRMYELLGLNPQTEILPVFFWDAAQEIAVSKDGRRQVSHPYFLLRRSKDEPRDVLENTQIENKQMMPPLDDSDLLKYFGYRDECYLPILLQEQLKAGAFQDGDKERRFSYVQGQRNSEIDVQIIVHSDSSITNHLVYSILNIHLHPLLSKILTSLNTAESIHCTIKNISSSPQVDYDSADNTGTYYSLFTVTLYASMDFIYIEPADITTDVVSEVKVGINPTT